MLHQRKRFIKFVAITGVIGLAILIAVVALLNRNKPGENIIASNGTRTINDVTGQTRPLDPTTCIAIFGESDWPESIESLDPIAVRHFQVGDFDFYRVGDDLQHPVGFGWFDDGKSFWWAQKNGLIRSATFPEMKPLRELSFQKLHIHQRRERPVMEKKEPWRKLARELGNLDFRSAVCVGNRLIAMFGSPDYSVTNLVEIHLPTLDVVSSRQMAGFYYDLLELDDGKTIVAKGDDSLGFVDALTLEQTQVFKLGGHRRVSRDGLGLAVSLRDKETFSLDQSGSNVSMNHRPDNPSWRIPSTSGKQNAWYDLETDEANQVVTVRDSQGLVGFANGFALLGPQFHPDGNFGLVGLAGIGTRMPGFGILDFAKDSALREAFLNCKPVHSQPSVLPEITNRSLKSEIPMESNVNGEFTIDQLNIDLGAGHVAKLADSMIFDDQHLYYDCGNEETRTVARINCNEWSIDWTVQDARICVLTDRFVIVESRDRFLVLDKETAEVIRDLGFDSGAQFAAGHTGDFFIADRFDSLNSPAAINAATGDRLLYYARYGAGSSPEQLAHEDSRWYGGTDDTNRRRFSGMTVISASNQKPLELSPCGNWVYSRFGLMQFSWPGIRYSDFSEMPQTRQDSGPEFRTQHFSRDSRFAFFPDARKLESGETYVGLVRSLEDPDADPTQLTTKGAQLWIDQNPLTGNFWVRVLSEDEQGSTVMRMVEFDLAGKQLRDIADFTNEPQERRFLANGDLVCLGDGQLLRVKIR